ncbi:hypothetical protein PCC9214_05407 (plasmid) [Planktothrix tepida]|uniref:PEP-CTERM protein-sorting domain-containing protein n=1 Tax=Planktothrix tepida PCC 9214 TaxID=671072 RepID=A0A1J1LPP9_9CYAN|nr:hypothetical protein [Planktothrix tepida]CAD5988548.1 hypothetical protein PCC9214_05407 [Planktothrix tepida]CUR33892.1 conserved exported hypothetical protein [Planktothrix tepida PCC 9214]
MNFLNFSKRILEVILLSSTVSLLTVKVALSQPENNILLDTTVLDQEFVGSTNLGAFINEGFIFVGQTYTAGLTGTLTGVNIDVNSFNDLNGRKITEYFPLRVAIHEVSAGLPTRNILGETILNSSSASLNNFISFSQTIPQVIGKQYAIIVNYFGAPPSGAQQGIGIWSGRVGNEYLGGQLVFSNELTQWDSYDDNDLNFRTFVNPGKTASVPESSSVLSLLMFGALGGSLALKKIRTSIN